MPSTDTATTPATKTTLPPKSWLDVIAVHPAADLFPLLGTVLTPTDLS